MAKYGKMMKHSTPFTVYHIQLVLSVTGVAKYCSSCSGRQSSAAEGPNQPAALFRRMKQ